MAKTKILSGIVVDIEKGLLVMLNGNRVVSSVMTKSVIGDSIKYFATTGVKTVRVGRGSAEWKEERSDNKFFFKQVV